MQSLKDRPVTYEENVRCFVGTAAAPTSSSADSASDYSPKHDIDEMIQSEEENLIIVDADNSTSVYVEPDNKVIPNPVLALSSFSFQDTLFFIEDIICFLRFERLAGPFLSKNAFRSSLLRS
jgi:hypothetical protein